MPTHPDYSIRLSTYPNRVYVRSTDPLGHTVPRDEFAQAVRDLGFIVFEEKEQHIDLYRGGPNIGVNGHYRTVEKEFYKYTPEEAETLGLRLLALSAHLKATPPVDEEKVARVIAEMQAADVERTGLHLAADQYRGTVLRLIAAGLIATDVLPSDD